MIQHADHRPPPELSGSVLYRLDSGEWWPSAWPPPDPPVPARPSAWRGALAVAAGLAFCVGCWCVFLAVLFR